jgi:hypothetical protein
MGNIPRSALHDSTGLLSDERLDPDAAVGYYGGRIGTYAQFTDRRCGSTTTDN